MIDYQEELEQYQERIDELAKEKRYAELRDLFLPMEPADIALLLEESGGELMPLLYRLLPKELAAEVFVELESDSQEMLINGFSNTELKEVLDELYLDDAVDIVEEMPASVVIRILDKATPEMRKSINEILKYPEDSTGSIMNMEFLSLKKDMTVEDAFKRIRRIGGELETINILYVTDPTRRLLGVLEQRHLDSLTAEEELWRRQVVNGTPDGRIPQGESMQELSERMHAALASCLELPAGSRPLLVSHGIALGCLVSTILGLPAHAERRLRLRNCSISRVDYQQSLWLASGWVEAAWAAPGEAAAASFSTASSDTISPATLAKRFTRPTIFTKPSASTSTTSPVSYQPSPAADAGACSTPGFSKRR